jgi:hypothetical protein
MAENPFVGTWRLVSCTWTDTEGRVSYPYGQDPQGYLIYTDEGHMAVNFMSTGRARFRSDDPAAAGTQERRQANKTYQSYSGTYQVEGDQIVHHVEVSLFPNWVGTDQRRIYQLTGDRLSLSTLPLQTRGEEIRADLVWQRVSGPNPAGNGSSSPS